MRLEQSSIGAIEVYFNYYLLIIQLFYLLIAQFLKIEHFYIIILKARAYQTYNLRKKVQSL